MLNQLGAQGLSPIQARVADVKAMGVDYIHNKGVIVDGVRTLISSINWDANAVLKNREAAVVIDSPDVGAYYSKIFDGDWTASGGSAARRAESPIVGLVAPAAAATADVESARCPSEIAIHLSVGQLVAGDQEDRDYLALSQTTIKGTFVRKQDLREWFLLVEKDGSGSISF